MLEFEQPQRKLGDFIIVRLLSPLGFSFGFGVKIPYSMLIEGTLGLSDADDSLKTGTPWAVDDFMSALR